MEGAKEPQVKGVAFLTCLTQLQRARGEAVHARAIELLPDGMREAFTRGALVPNGWYPVAWYRGMWRAIRDAGGGGAAFVQYLGKLGLQADASTIHKTVFRLLSPATIASLGARYFSRMYDTGGFTVIAEESTRLTARFEGCTGFDRNMWVELVGSIEGFVEMSGAQGASARITEGGGDGQDWAVIVARWQ